MRAASRDFITVKLKEETAAQLAKRTIAYDTGFVLPPGAYSVKFLARENETGKMGTFQAKFVVPDLSVDKQVPPDQLCGPEQPAREDHRHGRQARA